MLYTDLIKQSQLTESAAQELDEISLDQIGRGIGSALGGIGRTAGAVAGVPQGIGRAIKKGYRGSVKGIGGEADPEAAATPAGTTAATPAAQTQPEPTPPGKAEMPIGSGTINPKTGRPYVPSDFPDQPADTASDAGTPDTGTRTEQQIQADLRKLESAYKMRRNALMQELDAVKSAPPAQAEPAATGGLQAAIAGQPAPAQAAPEPISIGGQKIAPTDPLYSKIAAQAGVLQNQPLVRSIQALDKQKLETVKQILKKKASGQMDEALGGVIRTAGKGLAAAGRGAVNLAKGVKLGVTNPQAAANLSKNPSTGTATKIGRGIGRGLSATGQAIKATPGALAKGTGAVAGAFGGMKQAYAKGKQASTKFIGQGDMSWDDLQVELANLSVDDAKALLSFVNQITMSAPAAKSKSSKKPAAKAKPAAPVKKPTFTGRKPKAATMPASATVHESLTWSKNFDPSRHLITQLNKS